MFADPAELIPYGIERKRIENRRWPTTYRGPLAIHAGKSRAWLGPDDAARFPTMIFGAVIGLVDLIGCVRYDPGRGPVDFSRAGSFAWVVGNQHAEGPYCFLLDQPRLLRQPFYVPGRLGLWPVDVPEELLP